jgi:two-component system cell cycle sensor histidine kinase/response regulator CckA
MRKGTETILLVEDEEAVRVLARMVLQSNGYKVLEARHGEDALSLAAEYAGPIDILLSDVLMPRMGGRQLAARLAEARPNLRVLFMSGYGDDGVLERGPEEPSAAFIGKPFSPQELARRVRQVLDGDRDGAR